MARRRRDIFSRGSRINVDLMLIPDDRLVTAEYLTDLRALRAALEVVLAQIPQKYADIIRLLYGFHKNQPPLSTSEAARILCCSQERIACMRCIAITMLAARYGEVLRPFAPPPDPQATNTESSLR